MASIVPNRLLACFLAFLALSALASAYDDEEYRRVNTLVRHIEPSKFKETVQTGHHLVFFGSNYCIHCRAYVSDFLEQHCLFLLSPTHLRLDTQRFTPAWLEAQKRSDELNRGFHLGKVECTGRAENEDLCVDEAVTSYPTVKLYVDGEFKEEYNGPRDIDSVNQYVDEKTLKIGRDLPDLASFASLGVSESSKTVPNEEGAVVHLTDKTHAEMTGSGEPWLIMHHAPWCGHCKNLKPEFDQLAKDVKGQLNIGAVDCTVEKEICRKYRVRGYPTILYVEEPAAAVEYRGPRSAKALRDFASGLQSKPDFEDITAAQIPSLLTAYENAFYFVYDPRYITQSSSNTFRNVARPLRHEAKFFAVPDFIDAANGSPSARALLTLPETQKEPALVAVRDQGTLHATYPLAISDDASAVTEMTAFIRKNNVPRIQELNSESQGKILTSKGLVVIAITNPEKAEVHNATLHNLRATAIQWEASHASGKSHSAVKKPEDGVFFTWLDGLKWQEYVGDAYNIYPRVLPRILIADPKDDKYYEYDLAGTLIEPTAKVMVQTLADVAAGKPVKPSYTGGVVGRFRRGISNGTATVFSFIRGNFMYLSCFFGVAALAVLYSKKGKAAPKAVVKTDPKAQ
ncbi:hypothetical protein HKX48_007603 [Thoreauomyces humboldtii]|nr:hypothetical protein HKX48_007603 [Thoreauomyces humboldtii]